MVASGLRRSWAIEATADIRAKGSRATLAENILLLHCPAHPGRFPRSARGRMRSVPHGAAHSPDFRAIHNCLTCTGPLAEIGLLGGQRIQRGLVESRELRVPRALAFAKGPLVDAVAQIEAGLVQFFD